MFCLLYAYAYTVHVYGTVRTTKFLALKRLLVFCPGHELRSGRFHLLNARLDVVFRHISPVSVHYLLQTHDAQQCANDGKLSKNPRVQQPHLKRLDDAILPALAVKNVGHRGHANGSNALERIVLNKVGGALVGRQRRCVDQADARAEYRLAVELAELDLV
mmetsp:Transcript_1260/g.2848  ORF Transcript_1260/g.2848 Transcript_1260/m.2848 type:complete len:161 (+) Transcript_1260:1630-2112(+)